MIPTPRRRKLFKISAFLILLSLILAASLPESARANPPGPVIEVVEKSSDPLPPDSESAAADRVSLEQADWGTFEDLHWQFSVQHPEDWSVQNDPYLNFGVRISSPSIRLDELGDPLDGAFFTVSAAAMTPEDWAAYQADFLVEDETTKVRPVDVGGEGGWERSRGISLGRPIIERFCYQQGYFYRFTFLQADHDLDLRRVGVSLLDSIDFTGVPQDHPLPDYAAMGWDLNRFSFSPLKLPFQNGSGRITSGGGYNNGDMHRNYDLYAFDFCENGTCIQSGRWAIAPTNMTFVHTASNPTDYHFFEITNDGSTRLCLSLGHFYFGDFGVPIVPGMRFPRGAVLGALSNFNPPHLHMGIWTAPISSTCWESSSRVPLPYSGSFALDGQSYPSSGGYNEYANTTVTSTNYPICAMPTATRAGEFETREVLDDPGGCFSENPGTLSPPTLQQPNQGQVLTNRTVQFVWSSPNSPNQTGYTFRLNQSANPDSQPWIVDTGLGNEYQSYAHTFSNDGLYYWHMRTWNSSGQASAWTTRSFSIDTTSSGGDVVMCGSDDGSSNCWALSLGVFTDLSAWGLNDTFRSVFVPSGKSAFLFREGGLRGTAECYSGNRAPLPAGDPWDLRGQVTGVQTFNQSGCPSSSLSSVVVYDGVNYSGHQWGLGYYQEIVNFNQLGGPDDAYFNDRGESIRIPSGWSVRLYEHNDASGQSSSCLTGNVNDIGSLKNVVSSAKIYHNISCQEPIPAMPSHLTVSNASESSLTLAWQDNSHNESGFRLYLWSYNGSEWDFYPLTTVSANTTTYTHTGLACGTDYFYEISAYNNSGESLRTGWVKGSTAMCQVAVVTGAWVGNGEGVSKTEFQPGETVKYVISVYNATGEPIAIELRYVIHNPRNEIIFDQTYTVNLGHEPYWGVSINLSAPALVGSYYFQAFGRFNDQSSYANATYWVEANLVETLYLPVILR